MIYPSRIADDVITLNPDESINFNIALSPYGFEFRGGFSPLFHFPPGDYIVEFLYEHYFLDPDREQKHDYCGDKINLDFTIHERNVEQ